MSLADDLARVVLQTRDPRRTEPEAGVRSWLARQLVDTVRVERLESRAFFVLCAAQRRVRGRRQLALVAYDPADIEARDWVVSRFAACRPLVDASFCVLLDVAYSELIPLLEPLGFGPVKVELQGRVEDALAALEERDLSWPAGFSIRPLELGDIDAVLDQRARFFRANPLLGFSAAAPEPEAQALLDASIGQRLAELVASSPPTMFAAELDGRMVGNFGTVERNGAGGVDMFFVPEVHGRGFGWLAYAHIVRSLAARGVERLDGQTANPAVVHIGREIGRWVRVIHIGYDRELMDWKGV